MALVGLRNIIKCGSSISDSLFFSNRSVIISSVRNGTTVEEQPQESQTQEAGENIKEGNMEVSKLNQKIRELTEKNAELLDKYKRSLADGENLRNRLSKQIAEAKIFGIQSFCKDLLDVADVLNKATSTVPQEEISDKNPHLKSLYEGLVMTEAQLKSVFKRHGLEQVNPIDETFDPNYHEALYQQEVQSKEPGIVVAVTKVGYKLNNRVIRPALVGVSK